MVLSAAFRALTPSFRFVAERAVAREASTENGSGGMCVDENLGFAESSS
jgi:hypothetical protein